MNPSLRTSPSPDCTSCDHNSEWKSEIFFIFAISHIWSERRKCDKDVFKLWKRKSWPGLRGFRLKFSLFSHISAGAGSGPLGRRNKTLEREGGGGVGGGCQGHQNCREGGYSLSSGNTGIPGGNLASFFIPTRVVKRAILSCI